MDGRRASCCMRLLCSVLTRSPFLHARSFLLHVVLLVKRNTVKTQGLPFLLYSYVLELGLEVFRRWSTVQGDVKSRRHCAHQTQRRAFALWNLLVKSERPWSCWARRGSHCRCRLCSTGLCIWRPGPAATSQRDRTTALVLCGVIQMPLPQFRIFGGRECDGHASI